MHFRVIVSAAVLTAPFGSSVEAADLANVRYDNYTICAGHLQGRVQTALDSGKPDEAKILQPAVKQLQTKALNQGALLKYDAERVNKDIANAKARIASLLPSLTEADRTAFVRGTGEHCTLVTFGLNGAEDKNAFDTK